MGKQEEFVKQIEAVLNNRIGAIIASSVMKNNLAKLNKNAAALTSDDGKLLIENIVNAVSLFVAPDESKQVKTDLEKLLAMLA